MRVTLLRAVLTAALALLPVSGSVYAQGASQASVVATCGTPPNTYVAGTTRNLTQDTTGALCGNSTGGGGGTTTVLPTGSTSTDISGTVASGGVYQTAAAASGTRKNCTVQNPSTATEPLLVKFGTMAQPYTLGPGFGVMALNGVIVATDAITVTATTTGHAFAGTCQ